jgi:hypothetical protein
VSENRFQPKLMQQRVADLRSVENLLKDAQRKLREVCTHTTADGRQSYSYQRGYSRCDICGEQF